MGHIQAHDIREHVKRLPSFANGKREQRQQQQQQQQRQRREH